MCTLQSRLARRVRSARSPPPYNRSPRCIRRMSTFRRRAPRSRRQARRTRRPAGRGTPRPRCGVRAECVRTNRHLPKRLRRSNRGPRLPRTTRPLRRPGERLRRRCDPRSSPSRLRGRTRQLRLGDTGSLRSGHRDELSSDEPHACDEPSRKLARHRVSVQSLAPNGPTGSFERAVRTRGCRHPLW